MRSNYSRRYMIQSFGQMELKTDFAGFAEFCWVCWVWNQEATDVIPNILWLLSVLLQTSATNFIFLIIILHFQKNWLFCQKSKSKSFENQYLITSSFLPLNAETHLRTFVVCLYFVIKCEWRNSLRNNN